MQRNGAAVVGWYTVVAGVAGSWHAGWWRRRGEGGSAVNRNIAGRCGWVVTFRWRRWWCFCVFSRPPSRDAFFESRARASLPPTDLEPPSVTNRRPRCAADGDRPTPDFRHHRNNIYRTWKRDINFYEPFDYFINYALVTDTIRASSLAVDKRLEMRHHAWRGSNASLTNYNTVPTPLTWEQKIATWKIARWIRRVTSTFVEDFLFSQLCLKFTYVQ